MFFVVKFTSYDDICFMFILAEMNSTLKSALIGGMIPVLLITYIFILEKVKSYKIGKEIVDFGFAVGCIVLLIIFFISFLGSFSG